jgi:formate hydrogenlyase subunit 3/multisubunit Na+/H+ antiporter MnhD subunit
MQFALDPIGRLFLVFSAAIWLAAGLYAALERPKPGREGSARVCLLAAMGGNLLLILAADIVTFYAGFALMGLSAYGLVIQRRSQKARSAGRLYLAWTLAGELALFSAVVLLAAGGDALGFADLTERGLPAAAAALLVFGFGVKLALPGLHVWLPLTYAAAPPAAAAVLSGPMFNAGLLGWLRFISPGTEGSVGLGEPLVALGTIGAALGLLAGLAQRDPRALLGYSSIAKSGLIAAVFGVALGHPEAAPAIIPALALFAMQHLLVKGTMFLGLGEWARVGNRPWVTIGLTLLALALAGAPLTGGVAAKVTLDGALADAGADLGLLFAASAIGAVLLMARFLWLVSRARPLEGGTPRNSTLVWGAAVPLALWLPFHPADALSGAGLVPIAAGIGLAILVWWLSRGRSGPRRGVPPGDILHLLPVRRLRRLWRDGGRRLSGWTPGPIRWPFTPRPGGYSPDWTGLGWLSIALLLLLAVSTPG